MKILVIKIGALGDVVRTSFIAQALKDKYSNQNPQIYWITDKKAQSFFINSPYVNVLETPESKNNLRNIDFDLIINLEEDEESAKFVSNLRTKKIIGVFWNKGKIDYTEESKYWFDSSLVSKLGKEKADKLKKQNTKTHRQIMSEIIGVKDFQKYEPFLRLTEYQRNFAKNFARRYNLKRTELVVGINVGSGERWPKNLPIDKTVKLIDGVYKRFNAKILLFGGPGEENRNNEIMRKSNAPIISAGCGNDLIEFPALISVCNFFITTDTLGMHLALALKRKTISLFGPTPPQEIDMFGIGEKIVAKSNCIGCCKTNCKSMEKISLEEIFDTMKQMLKFKISLVITAFKEPNIKKAIDCALNQKTIYDYEVIVSAPDEETIEIVIGYQKSHKKITFFKDPGKGKMFALNLLIQ
jgi:heptosyltransferase-2